MMRFLMTARREVALDNDESIVEDVVWPPFIFCRSVCHAVRLVPAEMRSKATSFAICESLIEKVSWGLLVLALLKNGASWFVTASFALV